MDKKLADIEGFDGLIKEGEFVLDEDDLLLYALLTDSLYCAELLWEEPNNTDYGGLYRVLDYQYPLWRTRGLYCGFACGRGIGKTESIKGDAFAHGFRRIAENMLLTAPELIHLKPMTDAVESRILDVRLTREFLDIRGGKTGLTHKPFGVAYRDGTKIVGRIPQRTGAGVKGQHEPDLRVEEAQDFPERAWAEVHEQTPLDGYVLTPTGRRQLRDIECGDRVIARNGAPTEVIGLSRVTTREVWEVELDDGAVLEADAEHRWLVSCSRYLRDGKWQRKQTQEIAVDLAKQGKAFGSPGQPWLLPDIGPVQFQNTEELPIDPYTLGVLIGDGSLAHSLSVSIPPEKEPVLRECRLPDGDSFRRHADQPGKCPSYGICGGATAKLLGELDLKVTSLQKHVPASYLRSTIKNRLALLQGLVDTDGNVHRSGAIRFTTSSDRLVENVEELVRSLGGRCSKNVVVNRNHKDGWCLHFRLPDGLSPTRHKSGYRATRNDKMRRRIVAARPTGRRAEMRCIQVADPEHLFLLDGFVPTSNTVIKDHVDPENKPDFTYWFYGVHSGARDSGFYKRIDGGEFTLVTVTRLQTLNWSKAEKDAAIAAYGGVASPDYRRNILGEAGAPSSPFFVMSRLMASVDQDYESHYNEEEFLRQKVHAEEIEELDVEMRDVLHLPTDFGNVHAGLDAGLTVAPTVISLFSAEKIKGRDRLKLIRVYELWRLRPKQIRASLYALAYHLGPKLKSFGMDVTGLGFPMFQEMEDDESAPRHLLDVSRGYFFNAAVPVGVSREQVSEDSRGQMRDQFGSAVKEEEDPITGERRLVTTMPMIEASTRYVRDWIDTGRLLLPFDRNVIDDMTGETHQRVKSVGERRGKKPNAFHILDSFRAAAMAERAEEIEESLRTDEQEEVLDMVG